MGKCGPSSISIWNGGGGRAQGEELSLPKTAREPGSQLGEGKGCEWVDRVGDIGKLSRGVWGLSGCPRVTSSKGGERGG